MKSDLEAAMQALVTAGWANETSGSVEAPMGHLAIIDCTTERDMMREVLADAGIAWPPFLRREWAVVSEDSDGNVIVRWRKTEAEAKAILTAHEEAFVVWSDEEDEPEPVNVYADVSAMAAMARARDIVNSSLAQAGEELHNLECTPGQQRGNALWVLHDAVEAVQEMGMDLAAVIPPNPSWTPRTA